MFWYGLFAIVKGFLGGSAVKNLPANAGNPSSIPKSGRSPREGNGYPLQYSCLENPMDREPWWLWSMGSQKAGHCLDENNKWFAIVIHTHTNHTHTPSLTTCINYQCNSDHYKEKEEVQSKAFKYFKHMFHIILFSSGLATQECGFLSQEVSFWGTFCSVVKCLQVAINGFMWWHHHSCWNAIPLGSHIQHPTDGKSSFSISRNVRAGKYFLLSPGFWQNNEITISNPLLQPHL